MNLYTGMDDFYEEKKVKTQSQKNQSDHHIEIRKSSEEAYNYNNDLDDDHFEELENLDELPDCSVKDSKCSKSEKIMQTYEQLDDIESDLINALKHSKDEGDVPVALNNDVMSSILVYLKHLDYLNAVEAGFKRNKIPEKGQKLDLNLPKKIDPEEETKQKIKQRRREYEEQIEKIDAEIQELRTDPRNEEKVLDLAEQKSDLMSRLENIETEIFNEEEEEKVDTEIGKLDVVIDDTKEENEKDETLETTEYINNLEEEKNKLIQKKDELLKKQEMEEKIEEDYQKKDNLENDEKYLTQNLDVEEIIKNEDQKVEEEIQELKEKEEELEMGKNEDKQKEIEKEEELEAEEENEDLTLYDIGKAGKDEMESYLKLDYRLLPKLKTILTALETSYGLTFNEFISDKELSKETISSQEGILLFAKLRKFYQKMDTNKLSFKNDVDYILHKSHQIEPSQNFALKFYGVKNAYNNIRMNIPREKKDYISKMNEFNEENAEFIHEVNQFDKEVDTLRELNDIIFKEIDYLSAIISSTQDIDYKVEIALEMHDKFSETQKSLVKTITNIKRVIDKVVMRKPRLDILVGDLQLIITGHYTSGSSMISTLFSLILILFVI